jgi:hypothetical protein
MIPLDQKQLESLTMNGFDVIVLMMTLTIEIVASVSATDREADERLINLANKLEGSARNLTEPRTKFLMTQLAHALIATERSS